MVQYHRYPRRKLGAKRKTQMLKDGNEFVFDSRHRKYRCDINIDLTMRFHYFTALTVRFLTRRYIGEYDHQSGKAPLNLLLFSIIFLSDYYRHRSFNSK